MGFATSSATASTLGGLIQTAVGSDLGAGCPFGNLWMPRERLGQHACPLFALRRGGPVVDIVRREQPDPDVMMLGVVPGEEVAAETAPMLDGAKAVRL
jgi:hypothetical protein